MRCFGLFCAAIDTIPVVHGARPRDYVAKFSGEHAG
jgi:hypothetical protein